MSCIEECISEREYRRLEEGLVKVATYQMFGRNAECNKYLTGVSDTGTRHLFSGTQGLNEELEVEKENRNVLCVVLSVRAWCMCCGSVRPTVVFMMRVEELLGDRYADFEVLNRIEKTSYVLETELWEQNFKSLLRNLLRTCGR